MSADNGIYILKTQGPEYRVRHLQAIDNICWDNDKKCECSDYDVMIVNARDMWYGTEVFSDEESAFKYARELEKDIGYTEYGISKVGIDRCFNVKNCIVEVSNPCKSFYTFSEAYDFLMNGDNDLNSLYFNLASGERVNLQKIEVDGKFYLTIEE